MRTESLRVRLRPETLRRLRQVAARRDKNVSELVRHLVMEEIDRDEAAAREEQR